MPLSAPVARAIRAVPAVSKQDVVVQFDNVRLDYAGKKKRITALDASNFSIRRGEFVAFTGPSGCGKSTILKLISGIIAPSAGSIFISGREIGAMPVRIGISFQNPTLLPWLTVRRNVMMPLRLFRLSRTNSAPRKIVNSWIERMRFLRKWVYRNSRIITPGSSPAA